jgi:uncharacterized protein
VLATRALLASPLGFLIGMSLGALGGGGSILLVPVLVFVVGQTASAATTTSLVVVCVASLIGAHGHWRAGRVQPVAGTAFGVMGIGGSFAGSALNRQLDPHLLLLGFAVLTLVAAWRIIVGCPSCTQTGEARAVEEPERVRPPASTATGRFRRVHLAEIAAAATSVGFLTGLFGVGGGFLIVPALAIVLGFPMGAAIGTSLLVIAINAGAALLLRVGAGGVEWGTTILFGVAAVTGVGVGRRLGDKVSPSTLQRSFAGLLVGVALYTGARAGLSIR